MVDVESAILACERSGAIIRHRVTLERGEFDVRRLWLRKEVDVLIGSAQLESTQREVVRAALRRFVVGGNFTVVTADCKHNEVVAIGDIRELKETRLRLSNSVLSRRRKIFGCSAGLLARTV